MATLDQVGALTWCVYRVQHASSFEKSTPIKTNCIEQTVMDFFFYLDIHSACINSIDWTHTDHRVKVLKITRSIWTSGNCFANAENETKIERFSETRHISNAIFKVLRYCGDFNWKRLEQQLLQMRWCVPFEFKRAFYRTDFPSFVIVLCACVLSLFPT